MALDFGSGGNESLVEALELVFDGIARQEPARDTKSLVVHDKHFADRHAGRNGNSLQTFHVVSRFDSSLQSATRSLAGAGLALPIRARPAANASRKSIGIAPQRRLAAIRRRFEEGRGSRTGVRRSCRRL